ncbi:hypothetical protein PMAYCL1PPCAC_11482, partial [Pristionchus mayeri]
DWLQVPAEVTTYWCVIVRLPEAVLKRKHHITWLWNNVTEGNENLVHHIMLFHCPTGDQQEFAGNCNDPAKPPQAKACSKVLAAAAKGQWPTKYPLEVGMPMGGPGYNPYVMIEMHYDNPAKMEGVIDSSGYDIVLTPNLRPNDAAVIEIGQIYGDANSIPPHQPHFEMSGYCTADCTAKFPEEGINVFVSQLHAHLAIRKISSALY